MHIHPFITPLESRRFLTVVSGIVFADTVVKNGQPDPGEGLPGCVVTFNNNVYHNVSTPVTAADGSYVTDDIAPGTYSVNIAGPNIKAEYNNPNFVVGNDPITYNFEVDAGGGHPVTPPDLSVTVSAPPKSLPPGVSSVPLIVTVTNKGGAFDGSLDVTVYFSQDKIVDPADPHLPTMSINSVSIGAHSVDKIPFDAASLAPTLAAGKFYILVDVNPSEDSNSANNTCSSKIETNVIAPSTNLVPTFKGKLAPSKTAPVLPFKLNVKNTGSLAASGLLNLTLVARPKSGGADIPLSSLGPISIATPPNKGVSILSEAADVSSLPAGSYRLVVTISSTLTLAESSTLDNTAVSTPFTIK